MAFNIFFHGLVCHRTEENTAVFIAVKDHALRMVVRKEDVVSSNGFESDPEILHLNPRINAKDQTSYLIAGRVLTVGGVTPTAPTFTSYFRKFVPSLGTQSDCNGVNVRQVVKDRRIDGLIAGYLVHPGGAYSVNDFFPEKATLTGNEADANCIARTIQLALTTNGGNVTISDGRARITLKPDGEARFVNIIPPPIPMNETNRHFGHYFHAIYQGCNGGRVPGPAGGRQCTHRHDPSFAVPGADCSNSGQP